MGPRGEPGEGGAERDAERPRPQSGERGEGAAQSPGRRWRDADGRGKTNPPRRRPPAGARLPACRSRLPQGRRVHLAEELHLGLELKTPKRSRTRRRPSAISAITSAVVASPVFSTKFACFSEKRAPPTWSPRQPASSSSTPALRPSARGSSGFLKVEPNVLMPDGWASLRVARISASVALIRRDRPGASAKEARATISRGPRFELR